MDQPRRRSLAPRAIAGGVLMGLANLVPGISGGTMLLATGIYPRFIEAVAQCTRLRPRRADLGFLALVVAAGAAAVFLLAGPVKTLVVEQRWVMYSLFIGLTLGGVPVVWRLVRPANARTWGGAALGLAGMVLLAVAQAQQAGGGAEVGWPLYLLAGVAGASAMILPGLSGGYLLLLLGVYVPLLGGIDEFGASLRGGDVAAALGPALAVLLPVGLGVLAGVALVSNALRWLLRHQRDLTLGVLLGLLVGAVAGLWPFQRPVEPVVGETVVKGRVVTAEWLAELEVEDWPSETFGPSGGQVAGSVLLVLAGFGLTLGVARLGGRDGDAAP